jgi:hypothetical protein
MLEDEEVLIDEEVVDSYGTGTSLLLDELVVVVIVVVVGSWYCEGTSLLDEIDIIELETIELDIIDDDNELETIELDIIDETELETGDWTTLLLLVEPYTGGISEDELIPDALLDAPGYAGLPASLTAKFVVPGRYVWGVGFK